MTARCCLGTPLAITEKDRGHSGFSSDNLLKTDPRFQKRMRLILVGAISCRFPYVGSRGIATYDVGATGNFLRKRNIREHC